MVGIVAGLGSTGIIAYPDLVSEEIAGATFYTMHDDGTITHDNDLSGNLRWVVNTAPQNYEVRFNGGSWQDFSADRTINATATIDLRDRFSLSTVKSVTVTLS